MSVGEPRGQRQGVSKPRRWLGVAFGAAVGLCLGGVASLLTTTMVEATNTAAFCATCHEMEVFRDTWETSLHGSAKKGVVFATCTDCHLPPVQEGVVQYLFTKGKSGTKDILGHVLGWEPDWVANLERREDYTFESGCRKCHVELVAEEIPLKAVTAHRDYMTGQTAETCIGCHSETGHGNLKAVLEGQAKSSAASESVAGGDAP